MDIQMQFRTFLYQHNKEQKVDVLTLKNCVKIWKNPSQITYLNSKTKAIHFCQCVIAKQLKTKFEEIMLWKYDQLVQLQAISHCPVHPILARDMPKLKTSIIK